MGRPVSRQPKLGTSPASVVIVDGRVLDPDAETRQQFVEVGAVLVFLRLAERQEAASGGREGLDRRDLPG